MKLQNFYILVLLFSSVSSTVLAATPSEKNQFREKLRKKASQVSEFAELVREADRIKVKLWLFGGSSSTFAHYVKNSGTQRPEFIRIFRSTQDIDLVIDGNPNQVVQFQKWVEQRFPYFLGEKSQWEVRALRYRIGDKSPLLGHPDFIHQNTDSHSTGLIELTGHPRFADVRDLRHWKSPDPVFLEDVLSGALHYYHSEEHNLSPRVQAGLNPPIFSAIRYLTKLFQFNLKPLPEDLIQIKGIVSSLDLASIFNNSTEKPYPYLQRWFERNGLKMLFHSKDLNTSLNLLEEIGLKQKLEQLPRNGFWFKKKPLPFFKVGGGKGRTLNKVLQDLSQDLKPKQNLNPENVLFLYTVEDLPTYEMLTASSHRRPNVFIETTDFGLGHPTDVALASHLPLSGFTVRYRAHPDSREGTDFTYENGVFLWKNAAALSVVKELTDFHLLPIFESLAGGKKIYPENLDQKNLFSRWIRQSGRELSETDLKRVLIIIKDTLQNFSLNSSPQKLEILKLWFSLSEARNHIVLTEFFLDTMIKLSLEEPSFTLEPLLSVIPKQNMNEHFWRARYQKIYKQIVSSDQAAQMAITILQNFLSEEKVALESSSVSKFVFKLLKFSEASKLTSLQNFFLTQFFQYPGWNKQQELKAYLFRVALENPDYTNEKWVKLFSNYSFYQSYKEFFALLTSLSIKDAFLLQVQKYKDLSFFEHFLLNKLIRLEESNPSLDAAVDLSTEFFALPRDFHFSELSVKLRSRYLSFFERTIQTTRSSSKYIYWTKIHSDPDDFRKVQKIETLMMVLREQNPSLCELALIRSIQNSL